MSNLRYEPYRRDDFLRDPKSNLKKALVGALLFYAATLIFAYAWLRPEVFHLAGRIDVPAKLSDPAVLAWHDERVLDKERRTRAGETRATLRKDDAPQLIPSDEKIAQPDASGAKAAPPPAKAPPPTILWPGTLDVSRCWTGQGVEVPASQCDDLPELRDALAQRLHVIADCRDAAAKKNIYGKIVFGIEVDYSRDALSIWKAPETDIEQAAMIFSCAEKKLEAIGPVDESPKYSRYMMFLPVRFPSPAELAEELLIEEAQQDGTGGPDGGGGGRIHRQMVVRVVRENVRVRTQPVDGSILDMVSAPEEVLLIEEQRGWCSVITGAKIKGWMVCWGLDVSEKRKKFNESE